MSPMNPFSPPTHHPRPCKPAPTVCLRTGIPASSLTTSHATPSLSLHGKQSELSKDQPHSLRWASHRPPDEAPPPEWHFRPRTICPKAPGSPEGERALISQADLSPPSSRGPPFSPFGGGDCGSISLEPVMLYSGAERGYHYIW